MKKNNEKILSIKENNFYIPHIIKDLNKYDKSSYSHKIIILYIEHK